tara:strand:+ start:87 stop:653 length:567 start_codon:yes stop_codon:yes gene_type:complete
VIKIEANGNGYFFRGKEISQKTYEFYKDDSELLYEEVSNDSSENPEEHKIGLYDESCEEEVLGLQLGSSSLDVHCNDKIETIEFSEENIKKLGINCKIKTVSLKDFIKEKKGFFFVSHEIINGTTESPTEISDEKIFDPKKISLSITNVKSISETQVITNIEYNTQKIDTIIFNGGGDLPEFQVVKVG